MTDTQITVPKEPTYELPEGRFRAEITGFRTKPVENRRGASINAIISFEVEVPRKENFECMARKVLPFELKSGSPLRRFLSGLLGADFFRQRCNQTIDLERELVGLKCEVVLFHAKFDDDNYKHPLVDVEEIRPLPSQQGVNGGMPGIGFPLIPASQALLNQHEPKNPSL